MRGMHKHSGTHREGIDHLKQSIVDILTTPIGSRVMRRHYGSRLFDKIDHPLNGELVAEIYTDIVEALFTYEPRFEVEQITVQAFEKSKITLDIEGHYLLDGRLIRLEGIEIRGK